MSDIINCWAIKVDMPDWESSFLPYFDTIQLFRTRKRARINAKLFKEKGYSGVKVKRVKVTISDR